MIDPDKLFKRLMDRDQDVSERECQRRLVLVRSWSKGSLLSAEFWLDSDGAIDEHGFAPHLREFYQTQPHPDQQQDPAGQQPHYYSLWVWHWI